MFFFDGGNGGWLGDRNGVIDFADGTAVHINSGMAGLALAFVIGKRAGFKKDPMRPHSLPLVMLGAGLLWFGWFGFNAGSALAANGLAAAAFVNTQVAAATAMLGWLAFEKIRHGAFTTLGAASGAVAGLVAITPAAGSVSPLGAVAVGAIAGPLCAWAVGLKYKLGFDDSLDAFGVHAVGGAAGALLIGLFATGHVGQTAKGLFYGGGFRQLGLEVLGVAVVGACSFGMAWLIGKAIDKDHRLPGLRGRRGRRHRPARTRRVRLRFQRCGRLPHPGAGAHLGGQPAGPRGVRPHRAGREDASLTPAAAPDGPSSPVMSVEARPSGRASTDIGAWVLSVRRAGTAIQGAPQEFQPRRPALR